MGVLELDVIVDMYAAPVIGQAAVDRTGGDGNGYAAVFGVVKAHVPDVGAEGEEGGVFARAGDRHALPVSAYLDGGAGVLKAGDLALVIDQLVLVGLAVKAPLGGKGDLVGPGVVHALEALDGYQNIFFHGCGAAFR